jgi:hypothetical protein
MLTTRITKTVARLRSGELPVAPAVRTFMDSDRQTACDGCGEVIESFERYYYARIRKVRALRFHVICHEAWARFKPSAATDQNSSSLITT